MADPAVARTGVASAVPLPQPFSKDEHLAFMRKNIVICIAITAINTLALLGVFPGGSYSAIILSCSNLGIYAISFIDSLRRDIKENGKVTHKVEFLCTVISLLALNILAIQGTLSSQMLGMGMILHASFTFFIWRAVDICSDNSMTKKHKNISVLFEMIPLALTVISSLGVTGVIGGPHGALILGMTALGGSAVNIVGKYWYLKSQMKPEDELPIYWKRYFLIEAIYGIGVGALGLSGLSSVAVGLGALIGSQVLADAHFIHGYLHSKYEPDQNALPPAQDDAAVEPS